MNTAIHANTVPRTAIRFNVLSLPS
jgi:hypothetical protein